MREVGWGGRVLRSASPPFSGLYQKDPKLWHPCCGGPTFVAPELRTAEQAAAARAYEESRTPEEKKAFGVALNETMDLWWRLPSCAGVCERDQY